jgi:hypothetical protein
MIWNELVCLPVDQLAQTDPVALNLEVARGIPALAHLQVAAYQERVDRWADDFRSRLPAWEREFRKTPQDWDNDVHLFRLGQLCFYTDQVLGIRYTEDQKDNAKIRYTDPGDLFLNGVIDTRQGTCANMAALHLAIGWRLGWPVSLALAWWHCLLRFDDGKVVWNIESSNTEGGFRANPDAFYMERFGVTAKHVRSGSDLVSLDGRQLLGLFVGLRGRHWWDLVDPARASEDYRLAATLHPQSRLWREKSIQAEVAAGQWSKGAVRPQPLPRGLSNSVTFGMGYQE